VPSLNKKVAACAHFVRSGERGSESRAGNLKTVMGNRREQAWFGALDKEKRVGTPNGEEGMPSHAVEVSGEEYEIRVWRTDTTTFVRAFRGNLPYSLLYSVEDNTEERLGGIRWEMAIHALRGLAQRDIETVLSTGPC